MCLERISANILGKKVELIEDNCNIMRFNNIKIGTEKYITINEENSLKQRFNNYATKEYALIYIISDLLSMLLMNFYPEDSKIFLKKMNLVITGNIKIEDIIKYYNIDLTKTESYEIVKRKIKKLESVK